MTLPRAPFTEALRAMVAAVSGFPVGDGQLPTTATGNAPRPYLILYTLVSPGRGGPPFGDSAADAVWDYQLTAVGDRSDQARRLLDRGSAAILNRTANGWANPINAAGVRESLRESLEDGGGDAEGGILTHAERFRFYVTPA